MGIMSARGWLRIATAMIGFILGVVLYEASSFRWLYVVDSKHLTFTQARMVQSLGALLDIPSKGINEDIIIFGGSGAYHSINDNYLNEKLAETNSNKRAHLVSFSSQYFAHTLAMMDYLPKRTGKPALIIITWSFWRFDSSIADDLTSYLKFIRAYDSSDELLQRLENGEYDYMLEDNPAAKNWNALKQERNIPKNNRLTTWVKYFL